MGGGGGEAEGERERARSKCFSSFGCGYAQRAAECPGSPPWFSAARRRDEPSCRKSTPRSLRSRPDSSKPLPQLLH